MNEFEDYKEASIEKMSEILYRFCCSERTARALIGYAFLYSEDEFIFHKRACKNMLFSCYEMIRVSRESNKKIFIFSNMNNELAIKLES